MFSQYSKSYRHSVNVNKFGVCDEDGKFPIERKGFHFISLIKYYFFIVKNFKYFNNLLSWKSFVSEVLIIIICVF